MTTGQKLVELSGLSGVSAGQHLAAITAGSGPGTTIFASQFTVDMRENEIRAVQKVKCQAPSPIPYTTTTRTTRAKKNVFCETRTQQIYVGEERNELFLMQHTNSTSVETRLGNIAISTKRGV